MAQQGKKPVKKKAQMSHEEEIRARKAAAKKNAAKKKEKKKRGKILLFIVEIFVLLLMVVVLYGVLKTEKVGKVELAKEDIVINEEVKEIEETTMKGYRNIALFGVDSTTGALTKNTRSDSIMIASINLDTGDCKLVSVYRDTYLNLGNDTYNKCNAAYAKGGPMQAINMLNMNLDLNITDFITVGFEGLTDTIEALGGVEIDVTEAEISHLNNYQISMVGKTSDGEHYTANAGTDYIPVTTAGKQVLNGLQATAYCRIRYIGDDFMRTQRQRTVLLAIAEKVKTASPATLNKIANDVFSEVYTSLDLSEIVELLGEVNKYQVVAQGGFPEETMRATGTVGAKGSCVIPRSLESNVKWLHEFLFEDEDYTPSEAVKEYSNKVAADTNSYVN
jgi:LCP family protein required for cell wall assembly